ncbi:hypothetical protein GCM10023235_15490 [Kitasatospora terrestris]|uniref:Probable membrane transporter protein n=1 Tax=Kitasatospora terrestris TaxID=258051 RepID=A0ABP9DGK4_9ACTN
MTAVLLALAAGAVVGLALGGLGGGGSMLAVPALIYLLGVGPATAATAGLLIVAATAASGLLAHARAGRVRWRTGALFTATGLPAAALGGTLSGHAPAALLTAAFAALAALAAWRMLAATRKPATRTSATRTPAARNATAPGTPAPAPRQLQPVPAGAATRAATSDTARSDAPHAAPGIARPDHATAPAGAAPAPGLAPLAEPATGTAPAATSQTARTDASDTPANPARPTRTAASDTARLAAAAAAADVSEPRPTSARSGTPGRGRTALTGAGLGLTTGLLGVGGGFLAVPALVSGLALSMAEATGTSLLVIAANSLAALVPRLGAAGDVPWAVVGPFAAAAVLGAWDGKRLAAKVSGRALQRVFASALLAVAALMLADAVL